MPIFEYKCPACNYISEEIRTVDEREDPLACEKCGKPAKVIVSLIARTADRWGDTNAHYDNGLGCVVENSMHREKLCKERGLIPVDSMSGNHEWEDIKERVSDKAKRETKVYDDYRSALKTNGGNALEAMSTAMPAEDCLAGKFDDIGV